MNNYVEINNQDVKDFLDEKVKEMKCSLCNYSKWEMEVSTIGGLLALPIIYKEQLEGGFHNTHTSFGVLYVWCGNCANTLLFTRCVIVNWKLAKQKAKK